MTFLRLPMIGVNDECAAIAWLVDERAHVRQGQVVGVAETSKATVELCAEGEGVLYRLVPENAEAKVGEPVALVHDDPSLDAETVGRLVAAVATEAARERRTWTMKAQLLAEAKGLRIEDVVPRGDVVKVADVLAHAAAAVAAPRAVEGQDVVDDVYPDSRRRRVLILGAGRGAVQVLDVLLRDPAVRPVGLLDDAPGLAGRTVMGVPVVGGVREAARLFADGVYDEAVISMSNARDVRRRVFEDLRAEGIPFANVIDPSVTVHSNVQLGQGNIIMAHCRLGSCAQIGDNNFLSAFVNIEHHNTMGSHCTFGPGVSTSSRVEIADSVTFGTGIFIEPGVVIGPDSAIASGVVLVGHVPAGSIAKLRQAYTIQPRETPPNADS